MIDIRTSEIKLSDYKYNLPEERIAKFPLKNRDESKLLLYSGEISHHHFANLPDLLPQGTSLFFNDTKVIPARLHFHKDTGAVIEIFLLEPVAPTTDIAAAMLVKQKCVWKCMVGNYKKWKEDTVLHMDLSINGRVISFNASIENRKEMLIAFDWSEAIPFVDVVETAGKVPLPPYIKREVEQADHDRYQTVYSAHEGAVAAPTAGLHFTDKVLQQLQNNGHTLDYLTLHVSAGTFQPVKEENAIDHPMHSEQIVVSRQNIDNLLQASKVVAVGTTSMRTLESLYWYGVKLLTENNTEFSIPKLYPYEQRASLPTTEESLQAIKKHMIAHQLEKISGHTEIFIFPGYQFKLCKGLITNYHLPGSTLIMLVAAFIGENWRKVYQEALKNDYRFLSYGDSSLLLP